VAGTEDLGIRSPMSESETIALREVILHMIEEYARHVGHADLLRERIDGRVGQLSSRLRSASSDGFGPRGRA